MDLPLPGLMGQHQIVNAGTAVAAALELKRLGLTDAGAIERGLIDVRWPARMQPLNNGPLSRLLVPGSELWLDGGHNPAGAEAIAQTLAELEERAPKPVGLVVGMMGQKDAPASLRISAASCAASSPCRFPAPRPTARSGRPRRHRGRGRPRRRARRTSRPPSAACSRRRASRCGS